MTAADLPGIVAAMRSPEGWDASMSEMAAAFLMLADERDRLAATIATAAEKIRALPALRADGWQISGGIEKRDALRALGVDP